jgi:branched-chain amino acid transport system substrate-binding protein
MKRFLTILAALSFIGGCGLMDDTPQVSVGVSIPLSGEYADFGKRLLAGLELKREEINAHGGINGNTLKLVIRDNASTPQGAANAADRLGSDEDIPVIIGAYNSLNTFCMRPEARKYRIPVITPTGTADRITENNDYLFRACFTDSIQGKALGLYAYHRAGLRRIAILVDAEENGTQCRNIGFSAKKAFLESGGEAPLDEGYYRHEVTFRKQIARIMEARVDGICLPATSATQAAHFIREVREAGFTGTVFGGDNWDEEELYRECGPRPGKNFYFAMFAADYNRPDVQEFTRKIMERTGRTPATCEAQGYDTLGIVAEVLRRGGNDRESALKLLPEIKNYVGVGGTISILPDRNADKHIFVKEIVAGPEGNTSKLVAVISPYNVRKIYDVPN